MSLNYSILDETYRFYSTSTADVELPTKLKVTLSRDLTYAEREALRVFLDVWYAVDGQHFDTPSVFHVSTDLDSRELAWGLHSFFGEEFFNVYIRAVHTRSPRIKV